MTSGTTRSRVGLGCSFHSNIRKMSTSSLTRSLSTVLNRFQCVVSKEDLKLGF